MPFSDATRKQILLAECGILVSALNEHPGVSTPLTMPSKEELDKLSLDEVDAFRRELRDMARSLGGANKRG